MLARGATAIELSADDERAAPPPLDMSGLTIGSTGAPSTGMTRVDSLSRADGATSAVARSIFSGKRYSAHAKRGALFNTSAQDTVLASLMSVFYDASGVLGTPYM